MLYPICPTCGNILSNIQIPYQTDIAELCKKYNIDIEDVSRGAIRDPVFIEERRKIMDKYIDFHRYCCKMRLGNFSDIVRIVN
jgi:hypothetical protein